MKVLRSEHLTVVIWDLELSEPEKVVSRIMGEAAWTDPQRYRNAIQFAAKCEEALYDLPFMQAYIDNARYE